VVGNGRNWRCLEASFGDAVTSLHVIRPASGVSGVALAEWLGSKSLAYATASTAPLGLSRSILERFPVPERQVRDAELADALTEIVQARRVLGALASNVIENAFDEGDPSRASLRVRSLETSVKQVLSLAEPLSPDLSWRGVTMT
jgi:hypothetical protein